MEREVIREAPVRDREVIITDGARDDSPFGVIAAIVAIALVLLLGWFLLNAVGVLGGNATTEGTDVEVDAPALEVPDDINVNVDSDAQAPAAPAPAAPQAGSGG